MEQNKKEAMARAFNLRRAWALECLARIAARQQEIILDRDSFFRSYGYEGDYALKISALSKIEAEIIATISSEMCVINQYRLRYLDLVTEDSHKFNAYFYGNVAHNAERIENPI